VLSIAALPHHWFDMGTPPDEFGERPVELALIDESLIDPDSNTLRRAELLAARKRVYETIHPSSRHGGAPGRAGGGKRPRGEGTSGAVRSHAADAAMRTGLSERSIRQLVQIARGIPEPLRDLIRDTPLATRQRVLLEVARARRDPEEQRRRVGAALAHNPARVS
jgi:ParB family chromosome partitioning protein